MSSSIEYTKKPLEQFWTGPHESVFFKEDEMISCLRNIDQPFFLVKKNGVIGATNQGKITDNPSDNCLEALPHANALPIELLGDDNFKKQHNTNSAYCVGSMANGISSEQLVIALGKEGLLSSFGAGGLVPERIEKAIKTIQTALPSGPYAFNLIHSPSEPALERGAVDLYLKYGVKTIEASAFLDLTPFVVYYRVSGLSSDGKGGIEIGNRIIAKVSRSEVATHFLNPAPEKMLKKLIDQGLISQEQAHLASSVPMADDITVEADSGGHTDNRPLVSLLPSIISLRNKIQKEYNFNNEVRIGAAGGIGTPEALLAAFIMGAAYVVTGSVCQSCLESGTSDHVRKVLSTVGMADVTMAPASDMFEMGVKLQGLKRGTLFPMRAQKLYDLYKAYNTIDEIPENERLKIEKQIFQKPLDQIWQETVEFFKVRDPEQIDKANNNPKRKMALIFRWYLGLSSHWANQGVKGREMDYQIWCGPAMGAFNDWVRGTCLEPPENRKVVDVSNNLLLGASYLYRLQSLRFQGVIFPAHFSQFIPELK
ncbi:MAG: PfaD family polyunsaturated fatty acid/polyketide biosynthesis protein [Proteobacteria bacterium]|nr:PfaD family polyunsaturated fatty acid/polyketide biosynthesis protein [Pseudomonadota bacterium]